MSLLALSGLSKTYGTGRPALWNVDLAVESGEFIVLVGPSGCGKSTLLRLIAGLEAPSAGRIEIAEKDVTLLSPVDRGIGMVFQDYALYPHMTVRQNLAFSLKLRRTPREEIERRTRDTARMLGLDELLDRKPSALSGGQRQRVAIGRALIKSPALLLLDEPLSNLDAQLRVQTRLELKSLHRRIGSTTIYVTHDQEEAMTLADRLVVLRDGVVQQVDAPLTIYSRPANRYIASFVGSPRMNFIDGEVRSRGHERLFFTSGGQQLSLDGFDLPDPGQYSLGFRPEAARLSESPAHLSIVVKWLEYLGHEVLVVADLKGQSVVLRAENPDVEAGQRVFVRLEPKSVHWFRLAEGGIRVRSEHEAAA